MVPTQRAVSQSPANATLEPRKTAEKALVTVIQEAGIGGVSTRRVHELVQAMGLSGISKSQVSKLCKDINERVNAFLDRPLDGEWPYLWLDATYLKVRDGGRIFVSMGAIIAVAISTEGRREIVGLVVGPSEAEPFWSAFLKSLVKRGLGGVKLVISNALEGVRSAVALVLGATWQRCRVHWMRNALAHVPKGQHTMVAAATRRIDPLAARGANDRVVRRKSRSRRSNPVSSRSESSELRSRARSRSRGRKLPMPKTGSGAGLMRGSIWRTAGCSDDQQAPLAGEADLRFAAAVEPSISDFSPSRPP
jgi:transposase-like protein